MSMKEIVIISFKHNGKVHRTWYQTYLIEDNEDYIVCGSTHSLVVESDGRRWRANEPAISIFFKKSWYNVVCMLRDEGIFYYVNIASPCIYDEECIKYIDYDLDFKVSPTYEIKSLDEFEYRKHRHMYDYSLDLHHIIKTKFSQVKKMIINHEFPFNHETVHELYQKYEKIVAEEENKNDV